MVDAPNAAPVDDAPRRRAEEAGTYMTNVRLIDPASGLDAMGALLIRDGLIVDFGTGLGRPDGAAEIHGAGAVLCPGLVDMRAALGEPGFEYRETVKSAAPRRRLQRYHHPGRPA